MSNATRFHVRPLMVRIVRLLVMANGRGLLSLSLLLGAMLGTSGWEPPSLSMELIKHHEWEAPPQWHPERNSVVFSHSDSRAFYKHLYEVSTDGSLVTLIPGIEIVGDDDLRQEEMPASISRDLSRLTYADFEHDSRVPGLKHYDWEIVASDPDASNKRRLTNREGLDYSPVWSPDGFRIAFLSTRLGTSNIFTMDPDGSDVKSIAPSVSGTYSPLVWSPDGGRIAFALASSEEPSYWVLYAVGADGAGLTRLGKTMTAPAWSFDSRYLAFLSRDGNKAVLNTIGADGAGLKKVHELENKFTREDANVTNNLAWSPDGSRILLSGENMVAIVGTDGSEFEVLVDLIMGVAGVFLYSSWSPDGYKIAVNSTTTSGNVSHGFDPILFTMDPDGSNKRTLAKYVVEEDYTKYTADVGYVDKRVEPAHGETLPDGYERTALKPGPESASPSADNELASEVPRAHPSYGEWPSREIEEATGALEPGPALPPGEKTAAFDVLSTVKFSLDPDAVESMVSPCTKRSGGDCAPSDVSTINLTALSIRGSAYGGNEASSVEDVLEKGLFLLEESPARIAVRGTAQDDSMRCA